MAKNDTITKGEYERELKRYITEHIQKHVSEHIRAHIQPQLKKAWEPTINNQIKVPMVKGFYHAIGNYNKKLEKGVKSQIERIKKSRSISPEAKFAKAYAEIARKI